MKAEHRKELQTNALADRLGRIAQGFKTKSSSSGLAILVVAVLAVILVGVWIYFSRASKRAHSEMWVKLDRITMEELANRRKTPRSAAGDETELKKTIEKLEKLSRDNPGTKASLVARFRIAQIKLIDRGINLLPHFEVSAAAMKNLDEAEADYEKLARECKNDAAWEPQALLGIAKVVETRAVKDLKNLDRALALYESLADKYADTAAGTEAEERVAALKDKKKRAEIEDLYKDMGAFLPVDRAGP